MNHVYFNIVNQQFTNNTLRDQIKSNQIELSHMFSFQRWISQLNNEDNTEACNAKPAVIFPDQSHTLHMYIDVNYKIITAWGLWFFINIPVKLSLLISEYSSVICWGKGSSLEYFQKCELEDCLMAKKKEKVCHIYFSSDFWLDKLG